MILLTGCGKQIPTRVEIVTKTIYIKQEIPGELLDCKDLPNKKDNYDMQSDTAALLTDVWEVANSCKYKLEKVKSLVKE
ncbi:MAG: hypothetical protein WA916_13665 [Arcobacter sp.]|uniref:hypothetical protein n=1 Tax=Arcobacter sp. TaxID=1872629 RepID=UPI003C763BA5